MLALWTIIAIVPLIFGGYGVITSRIRVTNDDQVDQNGGSVLIDEVQEVLQGVIFRMTPVHNDGRPGLFLIIHNPLQTLLDLPGRHPVHPFILTFLLLLRKLSQFP